MKLDQVAKLLKDNGVQVNHQGIGSTPSCSQDVSTNSSYASLTEIHPGNYVFYDLQQRNVSKITDWCSKHYFCVGKMCKELFINPVKNLPA